MAAFGPRVALPAGPPGQSVDVPAFDPTSGGRRRPVGVGVAASVDAAQRAVPIRTVLGGRPGRPRPHLRRHLGILALSAVTALAGLGSVWTVRAVFAHLPTATRAPAVWLLPATERVDEHRRPDDGALSPGFVTGGNRLSDPDNETHRRLVLAFSGNRGPGSASSGPGSTSSGHGSGSTSSGRHRSGSGSGGSGGSGGSDSTSGKDEAGHHHGGDDPAGHDEGTTPDAGGKGKGGGGGGGDNGGVAGDGGGNDGNGGAGTGGGNGGGGDDPPATAPPGPAAGTAPGGDGDDGGTDDHSGSGGDGSGSSGGSGSNSGSGGSGDDTPTTP